MISKNFFREEFICPCGCGMDTVDVELITVLQDLRDYFNARVTVNSGNRCRVYNHKIKASAKSQHMLSKAADIVVMGISPEKVYRYLDQKYPDKYGMGNGAKRGFTHIDVRQHKARWSY